MALIPFPAMTAEGRKAQETGGRLINCYAAEIKGAPAAPVIWTRSAGMRRLSGAEALNGCRGMIPIGGVLLRVLKDRVDATSEGEGTFTTTELGPLEGDLPVTLAQNNASPVPDTVCVTENGTFTLFGDAAPAAFADGDLPVVNSVSQIDGYIVFTTAGGQLWTTDLNSTAVATNAFEGLPEGSLLRAIEFGNEIYAFGSWGFRVYRNAGLSPFPLEYTGVKRDVGLAGTHAVAGGQDGWAEALLFAGSDSRVYRIDGYQPVPVSTADVSRAIEGAADRSALQAMVYMAGGEAFWVLTNPGKWTFEYNLATGLWNERASFGRTDWRARQATRMFDRWVCGDAGTDGLFQIVAGLGSEHGDPLIYSLSSGIVSAFPRRLNAIRTWLRFSVGHGIVDGQDPIETDPLVRSSWSRDGGVTFDHPLERPLGREGAFDQVVTIGNSGPSTGQGLQLRLDVSDPVHAGFTGAEAEFEVLAP